MFGSKRKDAAFFDGFSSHAATSVNAAKLLLEMFQRLPQRSGTGKGPYRYANAASGDPADEATRKLCMQVKEAETAGDRITHETMKRLRANWLTPLDRTDIYDLISRLDDVLDGIEEAADRVVLFEVRVVPPEAGELAKILVSLCETNAKAIDLLHSMARAPEILELCAETGRLESAADAVHRKALADLYRAGNEPLVAMKWRDIFDSLESAADRCEDVANIIEGVVLEYA